MLGFQSVAYFMLIFLHCIVNSAVIVQNPEKITRFSHTHPLLSNLPLTRKLNERTNDFFLNRGKSFVKQQAQRELNEKIARNIVFFLGDGMSIPTISAARNLLGGEEKILSFESFPYVGMTKNYCVNMQVPDSACTSTAYLSGVKANYGTIGVSAKVQQQNCTQGLDKSTHTESIAKWAIDAGKSVGFVTNTRVTHASPAGLYAHTAYRHWESDTDVKKSNCDHNLVDDIAEQLIFGDVGSKLKVIFGGGRAEFRDQSIIDEEGFPGKRSDNKDLIKEWLKSNDRRHFVWNKTDMMGLHTNNTDAVLGLFDVSHCKYNYEIDGISDSVPTLTEMTLKAIELLRQNENGFLLFVEGGRIDMAHHKTMAHIALDETIAFSKAVDHAKDILEDDTLMLVAADHSHTMSYAGYGLRGTNVLGIGGRSELDNLPYMRLGYANGNGYFVHRNSTNLRLDPSKLNLQRADVLFPSTFPLFSETHGGDDTPVYAIGPWAHLFAGNFEQNVIPHMLAYASCIGNGLTACSQR